MAGRIRSIKPEILDDEKTAQLSHVAWRMFVSTWIIADDHGALRADPVYLSGLAFWGCPISSRDASDALEELASVGLVQLYEVRGQHYMQITNWSKHQKVDKPSKPRVPRMDDVGAWPVQTKRSDRVYFIRATKSRAIKIGVSWNPSRRLASLQAGHHEPLELVADVAGDQSLERSLHRTFSATRMSGEWFEESPELTDTIQKLVSDPTSYVRCDESEREPSRDTPRIPAPDLRSPISDPDHDRDLPARAILPYVPPRWGLQSPEEIAKARAIGDLAEATWKRVSDARTEQASALQLDGVLALPTIHPGKHPAAFEELRARIREEGDGARAACDHVVKALSEQARDTRSVEWLSEKAFLEKPWRKARETVLKQKRRPAETSSPGPQVSTLTAEERIALAVESRAALYGAQGKPS